MLSSSKKLQSARQLSKDKSKDWTWTFMIGIRKFMLSYNDNFSWGIPGEVEQSDQQLFCYDSRR